MEKGKLITLKTFFISLWAVKYTTRKSTKWQKRQKWQCMGCSPMSCLHRAPLSSLSLMLVRSFTEREVFFLYLCSAAGNCLPQRHKSKSGCVWSIVPQQLCCLWKQRLLSGSSHNRPCGTRDPSISATGLFVGILLRYIYIDRYRYMSSIYSTKYYLCNSPMIKWDSSWVSY